MNSAFRYKSKFLLFPLLFLAFILVGGFAVMLLWNCILPQVISGVGQLTYVNAIGLLLLCRILFGGFKGRASFGRACGDSYGWREKISGMSAEEKEKFKAEWEERCGRK